MLNTLDKLSKAFRNHINKEYKKHIQYGDCNSKFNIRSGMSLINCYKGYDWTDFKFGLDCYDLTRVCPDLNYYKMRIPVTYDNDIFDMYIIKWDPKSYSRVHFHSDYGCIMKVLCGELQEKRYILGNDNLDLHKSSWIYKNKTYNMGHYHTSYIDNEIGSHKIINPTNESTYSLHIYGFPNVLRKHKYLDSNQLLFQKI